MMENTPSKIAPSRPERLGRRGLAASFAMTLAITVAASVGVVALTHTPRAQQVVDTAALASQPTPGNFTGFAFDQCQAPKQKAMDAWMDRSPYLGVGIYIAGASRGCRVQTYLNPTWVHAQLQNGWKLLPITLGPQASCNPHFPRYTDDFKISAVRASNGTYAKARAQGITQAEQTINVSKRLGIVPGSTMYYDLEAFNESLSRCRESALSFLSGWTVGLHKGGYLSGVYSSANAAIKALDHARAIHQKGVTLPDQIWIADWDGHANTSSSYVSTVGWMPHRRIKQFQGGHNETYGGTMINVDRDFVDVGSGTVAPHVTHCGGVSVDLPSYPVFNLTASNPPARILALKCLLRQQHLFQTGAMNGQYGPYLQQAVQQWKRAHHWRSSNFWYREDWVSLLAANQHRVIKFGSGNESVRYVQRALNAFNPRLRLPITGVFGSQTRAAVRSYQQALHVNASGVVAPWTWYEMASGRL